MKTNRAHLPAEPPPAPAEPRSPFSHRIAWVVLAIALAASAGGWSISRMHVELSARKQFDEEANRIRAALNERMMIYEDVLQGAAGLFAASYSVERGEWRAYLRSVSIEKRFPGINGIGFVANVPLDQVEEFLAVTRRDRTPDFELKAPGTNSPLLIVKYITPERRHRDLPGTDMGTDPERRATAERARDLDAVVISSRLALRTGTNQQAGFLMLLPVYRQGRPADTLEERRANIEGWVYARFITTQFMQGILQNAAPTVDFAVFDGAQPEPANLIFATGPGAAPPAAGNPPAPLFADAGPLHFGGRTWTLRCATTPAFESAIPRVFSTLVGLGGAFASLLLFGIVWSLSRTREHALALARRMTAAQRQANERLELEIRDRRRAEQSIKDSEALYHSLVESLPLNIHRKDLAGKFTFANQRFSNEAGVARDQILGQTEAKLFPAETAARHQQQDDRVIETGVTVETVEELADDNGQKRYLQVIKTPVRDGEGRVVGVLGIFWDVTDKRHAEAELVHERFLLHTLMEQSTDRIYFKDTRSRFLRNSRAHLEYFHLTDPGEAIGKSDFDFFSPAEAQEKFEDEQRLMQSGQSFTKEERESRPDGTVSWSWSHKMPLRDEHGNVVGTFGISRDITDRKRAEEAMRQAKEAAEEASRTKSQFLANMSHELRTPLNSVIGFASILLKNRAGNLSSGDLNFIGRIQANGTHLLGLINQILDLSKIEAHKVELQLAPVALAELVRQTLAEQEGLVRDRPVKLRAELPARVTNLQADGHKLKQVIINLIGNALKFTERGSVTVRVVTGSRNDHPLRLEVTDTGIGIPADKLALVFDAFQQADASTARKYGGTGLGLTISHALCQLMGFRLEVRSEVGVGSTFSIILKSQPELPGMVPPAQPDTPAAPAAAPGKASGRLVLVIDDELDSRTLLTHLLAEFGCQVIAASSGEQGLRMAREFRPQLITVDLMMPSMNGSEVIQAIKADPELRHIPMVVVSIVAGEHRGRIIGVADYLQKPVDRDALVAVLRRNLPQARPRILVVDDDADARKLIAAHLRGTDVEILNATNGHEALQLLEARAPDLILLDLMMPGMDGLTCLNAIRADAKYRQLPVIVITAKDLTHTEAGHLREHAQEVLKKNGTFEQELKRLIERLLRTTAEK